MSCTVRLRCAESRRKSSLAAANSLFQLFNICANLCELQAILHFMTGLRNNRDTVAVTGTSIRAVHRRVPTLESTLRAADPRLQPGDGLSPGRHGSLRSEHLGINRARPANRRRGRMKGNCPSTHAGARPSATAAVPTGRQRSGWAAQIRGVLVQIAVCEGVCFCSIVVFIGASNPELSNGAYECSRLPLSSCRSSLNAVEMVGRQSAWQPRDETSCWPIRRGLSRRAESGGSRPRQRPSSGSASWNVNWKN